MAVFDGHKAVRRAGQRTMRITYVKSWLRDVMTKSVRFRMSILYAILVYVDIFT